MGFVVPARLDVREEADLKKTCLTQLYQKNAEIFLAFARVVYGEYRDDVCGAEAQDDVDAFKEYVAHLAMRLLDAPPRRAQNRQDIGGRDLTMAIWNHLDDRMILSGAVQDSMKQAIPYYETFARFIAIQTFGKSVPKDDQAAMQAASERIEQLSAGLRSVERVDLRNPFGRKALSSCED